MQLTVNNMECEHRLFEPSVGLFFVFVVSVGCLQEKLPGQISWQFVEMCSLWLNIGELINQWIIWIDISADKFLLWFFNNVLVFTISAQTPHFPLTCSAFDFYTAFAFCFISSVAFSLRLQGQLSVFTLFRDWQPDTTAAPWLSCLHTTVVWMSVDLMVCYLDGCCELCEGIFCCLQLSHFTSFYIFLHVTVAETKTPWFLSLQLIFKHFKHLRSNQDRYGSDIVNFGQLSGQYLMYRNIFCRDFIIWTIITTILTDMWMCICCFIY